MVARIDATSIELNRWRRASVSIEATPALKPVQMFVDGVARDKVETKFDFKKGHPGDLLIDVGIFMQMERQETRYVTVREMGTSVWDDVRRAEEHIRDAGLKQALIMVRIEPRFHGDLDLSLLPPVK